MIKTKIVSSQEKVFFDDKIDSFASLEKISALRGERLSVQLLHIYETADSPYLKNVARVPVVLEGELAKYAVTSQVKSVPVNMPIHNDVDDNYLRTTPGLYPDILTPLYKNGCAYVTSHSLSSVWIEIDIPRDFPAGVYELTASLSSETFGSTKNTVSIEVIGATLPDDDIYFTQWFHTDCLANYYNVDVWSERHWEIVENFARTARRGGINLLLTPVFTPPLDTAVGGERRTTQLVGVEKSAGKYSFDFSLLDRWIEMCNRCGIEYLEISHLFSQWGAAHAPKIMATVDGEYKKLFGWETDATSEEYSEFLRTFLCEFLSHMKARKDDKRCFFHISDEPHLTQLESYTAAKAVVADILADYPIMDALSNDEFYETGVLEHPIPSTDHIKPFLDGGVSELWTYYCVSQKLDVSNRHISMPLWRTRSIGMQMYKYNIAGFLQWGYNFYNTQHSTDAIDPFLETSAGLAFTSGDSFSVYPAMDGTALESIRFVVFYEALQDIKAMKLCEKYYGHDKVVAEIEQVFGKEITFDTCTKSSEMMLRIRQKVNDMIKDALLFF